MGGLRKHYAQADPRVKVIEERRKTREEEPIAPPSAQRERTQTERRRRVVPRHLPALPDELGAELDDIFWVQHLVAVGEAMEQLDDDGLYRALRARHREAPAELYWRWYARIHSRLAVLLGDDASADKAIAHAFGAVLDALEAPANAGTDEEKLIYGAVAATAAPHARGGHDEDAVGRGIAVLDPALDEPLVIRES